MSGAGVRNVLLKEEQARQRREMGVDVEAILAGQPPRWRPGQVVTVAGPTTASAEFDADSAALAGMNNRQRFDLADADGNRAIACLLVEWRETGPDEFHCSATALKIEWNREPS